MNSTLRSVVSLAMFKCISVTIIQVKFFWTAQGKESNKHYNHMFQKQCKRGKYICCGRSQVNFNFLGKARMPNGRVVEQGGENLRGTAMCSIIALSRSLLLPLPHVLPNVMLLCKVFLHIEPPVDF